MSGVRPQAAHAAAGPGRDRVRLVVDEQRAGLAAGLLEALEEARLGQHDADVRERGLGQHAGDVAARERAPHALQVVELDDDRRLRRIDLRPDVAGLRRRLAVLADHRDRLVDGAVVAPVEDEHLGPPLDLARDAQHEAVGVGRRERELPVGQPEAPAQLAGHPGRVLGGHHRRHATELAHAPGDGAHRRLRRVTGHRPRVAEREVDVLVAVDVGDACAVRLGVEERIAADPLRHPGHRHAEDLHAARLLGERARARRALAEERALALDQRLQARALDHRSASAHGGRACRTPAVTRYRARMGTSPPTGAVRGGHPALAAALDALEQRLDGAARGGPLPALRRARAPRPGRPVRAHRRRQRARRRGLVLERLPRHEPAPGGRRGRLPARSPSTASARAARATSPARTCSCASWRTSSPTCTRRRRRSCSPRASSPTRPACARSGACSTAA